MRIDLNCDVGESYGIYEMGADDALMPLISLSDGFVIGSRIIRNSATKNFGKHCLRSGHDNTTDWIGA